MSVEPTLGEALYHFRKANRLRHDEHVAPLWLLRIGDFVFALPNFAWRRRAIDAHDAHHLLTGYPCTVEGELLIAAWEFGAGRYPHWGATFFCMPFILIGLASQPRKTIAAFRRGRSGRSLYRRETLAVLRDLPLSVARGLIGHAGPRSRLSVPDTTVLYEQYAFPLATGASPAPFSGKDCEGARRWPPRPS